MGQRSQIYLRYNGELIVANYYGWNFGERMVSRARYFMEYLKDILEQGFLFFFSNREEVEKLRRYCDVNFDMKDIVMSQDIVEEWREQFPERNFCEYVFTQQPNNNGKLFVDVNASKEYDEYGDKVVRWTLKYAFTDRSCSEPLTVEEYLNKDIGKNWVEELTEQDDIAYTKDNIEVLNGFNVLSAEELCDFLENTTLPLLKSAF